MRKIFVTEFVSVDGVNSTTDSSKEVRIPVRYGPHTVFVQPRIPISIGSTTVQVGLTNAFSSWDDGGTSDPRGLTVTRDIVITAIYRISAEPSAALAIVAVVFLSVVAAGATLHRRKSRRPPMAAELQIPPVPTPAPGSSPALASFPRNDGSLEETGKSE